MTSAVDFKIYQSEQQEKKLTEIYLGSFQFSWLYAVAKYTADCTEALPFTPFDKVICGLLQIENSLSFEQLGNILGLNIIDNPAENKYKDIAEFEILNEALNSLVEFGMIEKGDSYFSRCRLTDIGREYAEKKLKFKTTENKEFLLFFDLVTNQHSKAKDIFQDLKGKNSYSFGIETDFEDETFLKSFAESQIPDIYSPAKGNSFANSNLDLIKYYELDLHFGVFQDIQTNSYKFVAHNPQGNSKYFTQTANSNESLKSKLFESFISTQKVSEISKSQIQTEFEDILIDIQIDIETLMFEKKLDEAIERRNQFLQNTEIIEIENFWLNINQFIKSEYTEIWLLINQSNLHIFKSLIKLIENNSHSLFFITYSKISDEEKEIEKQLFDLVNNQNNVFILSNVEITQFNTLILNHEIKNELITTEYIFEHENQKYFKNLILKRNWSEISQKRYENHKVAFANILIPKFISKCLNNLESTETEFNKSKIEELVNIDKQLLYFADYANLENKAIIEDVQKQKQEKIDSLKQAHQETLMQFLRTLISESDIDKIENLESLKTIKIKVENIAKDCFNDYSELNTKIKDFKTKIIEIESYIKDQLLAKHYIIDTNIFVDEPEILSKIESKHQIILSAKVVDELDNLKRKLLKDNKKENVENALRLINKSLGKQKNIRTAKSNLKLLPADFNDKSPDNFILAVALMYKENNPVILTNDNGLQVKSKIVDIPTINLSDFLSAEKYKAIAVTSNLPINQNTKKVLNVKDILNAYETAINPKTKKVLVSSFNESLVKNIKGFSFKDYGFSKFKDFCASLSDIFEIETDNKGTAYLNLKIKS